MLIAQTELSALSTRRVCSFSRGARRTNVSFEVCSCLFSCISLARVEELEVEAMMSTRGDRRWFPNWTHAEEARTHNLKEGDGSVDADTLDSAVHSFSCSWPQVCNTDTERRVERFRLPHIRLGKLSDALF